MSTVTNRVAVSPDQITGANERFRQLVQQMLQRYLTARGGGSGVEIHREPDVQLLWQKLVDLYPAFQRMYCQLFVEQLGPDAAIPVLRELQCEPLQRYLRARAAIAPELAANMRQLGKSWCKEV